MRNIALAGGIISLFLVTGFPHASAAMFSRTLGVGSYGHDVSALQQILKNRGYFSHPQITGYFGPLTQEATIRLQQAHGLDPVGVVGPLTRNLLNGAASASSSSATPLVTMRTRVIRKPRSATVRSRAARIATASTFSRSSQTLCAEGITKTPGCKTDHLVQATMLSKAASKVRSRRGGGGGGNGNAGNGGESSSSNGSISISSDTIKEGSELGETGLFFNVTGLDAPYTWSLTDGGGTWSVDPTTGELLLTGELDYESTASYTMNVVARRDAVSAVAQSVTINVNDVPSASQAGTVATNGATIPLYGSVREAAFYNESLDTTVFAWEGFSSSSRRAYVSTYNHATNTFGPITDSGIPGIVDDDHGVPAILQDHQGYGHLFGGSHYGSHRMRHSVTNAPNDFTAWTVQSPISGNDYSYPHPVLVDDDIYLFMRRGSANLTKLIMFKTTSLNNGAATWGSGQLVVDLGTNPLAYTNRVYAGNFTVVGTEIWFVAQHSPAADTERQNIYFFRYDTMTGDMKNFDGSVTVDSGDLPVLRTQADADFMLYEHTGTDKGTDIPVWLFDNENNVHIFFGKGPNDGPFDVMHMYQSGTGWQLETAATVTGRYDVFAPVLLSDNSIQLYYPAPWHDDWRDLDFPLDGEIMLKTRSASGTWSVAQKLIEGEEFSIGRPIPVLNGHDDARVIFAELADGNLNSMAGNKRIFIYGEGGFLSR